MGKVNKYDEITIKNQKKGRKYRNHRHFYINLHVMNGFGLEFTAR